jgi:hypothetical protein
MNYFNLFFIWYLERIISFSYICIMKNQTSPLAVSNGVATTASASYSAITSASSMDEGRKGRKVSIAKFVKRLNVTPMTAKGFNKRAKTMAKVIGYIITRQFQYAVDGNRVTAKDASDFVQDGMLSILNGKQVDMSDFTYNGEKMTQGKFFALWLKASFQQCQRNDQFGRMTRKCKVSGKRVVVGKIAVGSIATANDEGVVSISNEVESKALAHATSSKVEIDLAKELRNQFNMAESNADKRFWDMGIRILNVETSTLPTASACTLQGWGNRTAYDTAKNRWLADDRLQAIRALRTLRDF